MVTKKSEQPASATNNAAVLDEIYRRLVEVHYPLAEAPRVEADLHRSTLERLSSLLDYVDDALTAAKAR